jgi:hypothetical protein
MATICEDKRFSCPGGFSCNTTSRTCAPPTGAPTVAMSNNVNSNAHLLGWNHSFCGVVAPYLPSFCTCREPYSVAGGVIDCSISKWGETVAISGEVLPCARPARIDLQITSPIHYQWGESLPFQEQVAIPGLDFDIPGIGHVGAVVDITFKGNIQAMELAIGVDACADVIRWEKCGADLTHDLPIEIIDHTFDFFDICNGTSVNLPALKSKAAQPSASVAIN